MRSCARFLERDERTVWLCRGRENLLSHIGHGCAGEAGCGMSLTVERTFHLGMQVGKRGGLRRVVREGPEPEKPVEIPAPCRIPRVARLMALAIRCDGLLRSGAVPDATALARLGHVTQPRITQILNLTLLAPDIQEALLDLPPTQTGKAVVKEKHLRHLAGLIHWEAQRAAWCSYITAMA